MVFAALAALSVFVCLDALREYDAVYLRSEVLKESSHSLAAHGDRQSPYNSPVAISRKGRHSPDSAAVTASPMRVSLSTCVLLC